MDINDQPTSPYTRASTAGRDAARRRVRRATAVGALGALLGTGALTVALVPDTGTAVEAATTSATTTTSTSSTAAAPASLTDTAEAAVSSASTTETIESTTSSSSADTTSGGS